MPSGPSVLMMACQRPTISSSAWAHEIGSKRPSPLAPVRRSGVSTRSGEWTHSCSRLTLAQAKPAVIGWSGSPWSFSRRPSSTVASSEHWSGQSWAQAVRMVWIIVRNIVREALGLVNRPGRRLLEWLRPTEQKGASMAEATQGVKIDTVRSYSTGTPGRALNSARHNHFVLDSPSGPNEALTNGEAFLAGVSSCGVTLIEKYALEKNVPLKGMQVAIEGIRSNAEPNRFQCVNVSFEIWGVSQGQAEELVEVWKSR